MNNNDWDYETEYGQSSCLEDQVRKIDAILDNRSWVDEDDDDDIVKQDDFEDDDHDDDLEMEMTKLASLEFELHQEMQAFERSSPVLTKNSFQSVEMDDDDDNDSIAYTYSTHPSALEDDDIETQGSNHQDEEDDKYAIYPSDSIQSTASEEGPGFNHIITTTSTFALSSLGFGSSSAESWSDYFWRKEKEVQQQQNSIRSTRDEQADDSVHSISHPSEEADDIETQTPIDDPSPTPSRSPTSAHTLATHASSTRHTISRNTATTTSATSMSSLGYATSPENWFFWKYSPPPVSRHVVDPPNEREGEDTEHSHLEESSHGAPCFKDPPEHIAAPLNDPPVPHQRSRSFKDLERNNILLPLHLRTSRSQSIGRDPSSHYDEPEGARVLPTLSCPIHQTNATHDLPPQPEECKSFSPVSLPIHRPPITTQDSAMDPSTHGEKEPTAIQSRSLPLYRTNSFGKTGSVDPSDHGRQTFETNSFQTISLINSTKSIGDKTTTTSKEPSFHCKEPETADSTSLASQIHRPFAGDQPVTHCEDSVGANSFQTISLLSARESRDVPIGADPSSHRQDPEETPSFSSTPLSHRQFTTDDPSIYGKEPVETSSFQTISLMSSRTSNVTTLGADPSSHREEPEEISSISASHIHQQANDDKTTYIDPSTHHGQEPDQDCCIPTKHPIRDKLEPSTHKREPEEEPSFQARTRHRTKSGENPASLDPSSHREEPEEDGSFPSIPPSLHHTINSDNTASLDPSSHGAEPEELIGMEAAPRAASSHRSRFHVSTTIDSRPDRLNTHVPATELPDFYRTSPDGNQGPKQTIMSNNNMLEVSKEKAPKPLQDDPPLEKFFYNTWGEEPGRAPAYSATRQAENNGSQDEREEISNTQRDWYSDKDVQEVANRVFEKLRGTRQQSFSVEYAARNSAGKSSQQTDRTDRDSIQGHHIGAKDISQESSCDHQATYMVDVPSQVSDDTILDEPNKKTQHNLGCCADDVYCDMAACSSPMSLFESLQTPNESSSGDVSSSSISSSYIASAIARMLESMLAEKKDFDNVGVIGTDSESDAASTEADTRPTVFEATKSTPTIELARKNRVTKSVYPTNLERNQRKSIQPRDQLRHAPVNQELSYQQQPSKQRRQHIRTPQIPAKMLVSVPTSRAPEAVNKPSPLVYSLQTHTSASKQTTPTKGLSDPARIVPWEEVLVEDKSKGIECSTRLRLAILLVSCLAFCGAVAAVVLRPFHNTSEVIPLPVNDYCKTASGPLQTNNSLTYGTTLGATIDKLIACGTATDDGPGVWYTVTGNNRPITASTCQRSDFDSQIAVYTGDCGNLRCIDGNDDGVSEACGTHSSVTWRALPGVAYFLLVKGASSNEKGNFVLSLEESAQNDLCTTAIGPIASDGKVIFGSTTAASFDNAPLCGSVDSNGRGVWYTVVGTGKPLLASTCKGTEYDSRLSIFRGSCEALQCISSNDNGCRAQSSVTWSTENGETYFIMVHGAGNSVGSFELLISEGHENFLCETADGPLPTRDYSVRGSTMGITGTSVADDSTKSLGVWYWLKGNGLTISASTCTSEEDSIDTKLELYNGECGNLSIMQRNDDECGEQSLLSWFAEYDETYFLLVTGKGEDPGPFELHLTEHVQGTSCLDSLTAVHSNELWPVEIHGSTANFEFVEDFQLEVCGPLPPGPSVWYTFPGTGSQVTVSTCASSSDFEAVFYVVEGRCGDLVCVVGASGGCGSSKGQQFLSFPSVTGHEYFIVVFGEEPNVKGTFTLNLLSDSGMMPVSDEDASTKFPFWGYLAAASGSAVIITAVTCICVRKRRRAMAPPE